MKTITAFIAGLAMGILVFASVPAFSEGRYEKIRIYTQVFNLVEEHFVEKLNIETLVISSIRGLLGSLDPYSGYLSPKAFKKFKGETEGLFNGVGFELSLRHRKLKVVSVVEDSSAWKAGVLPGDQIVSINGKKIQALDFTQATSGFEKIKRGKVLIEVRRPGEDRLLTFKLRKEKIKIRPVRKVLNKDGVLVLRITSFSKGTFKELKKILEREDFKKIVLDLRNNPGGLLSEAIEVVDLFVSEGVIVKTRSRNPDDEVNLARKDNTLFPKRPLFILVDGASASASEIVASSLKDLKRAKVLGRKTFGKGSVQSVIPLPEKQGGVKLTIARYFTASDRMIDKRGVAPDFTYKGKEENIFPKKNSDEDAALQWALKKIN